MNIVYEQCAGLDVHKRTVVACVITSRTPADAREARNTGDQRHKNKELRTFSTMTPDLLRMRDWFQTLGVTHVAMESTGVFWKPIYNMLEGYFELLLVNAQHIKAVPRCGAVRLISRMQSGSPTFYSMDCFVPVSSRQPLNGKYAI